MLGSIRPTFHLGKSVERCGAPDTVHLRADLAGEVVAQPAQPAPLDRPRDRHDPGAGAHQREHVRHREVVLGERRDQRGDQQRAGHRRDPLLPAQTQEAAARDPLQERPAAGGGEAGDERLARGDDRHPAEASSALSGLHEVEVSGCFVGSVQVATFALIHGGGSSGWDWHLVVPELVVRGHEAVAVDLPTMEESAGWWAYADAVVEAVAGREHVVVAGHSLGGFTPPLVCARRPVALMVLVAAMIPSPGERFDVWWTNAGYEESGLGDVFYH